MKILTWPVIAGATLGIVVPLLTHNGNMSFCTTGFLRNTAGTVGMHQTTQQIRPELIGLLFATFLSAFLVKEFRSPGSSSPFIRIGLGFFAMISAFTFLDCPWRAYLHLEGAISLPLSGL